MNDVRNLIDHDAHTPVSELAHLISDTSEDCYCAGWLHDCEHVLWDMANDPNSDLSWGMGIVPRASLDRMLALSMRAGQWVHWDDERGGVHAIDLDAWKRKHAAWKPWYR